MAREYTLHRPAGIVTKIDYAAELNPQQCAVATAPPGAALVIAGAGSGKTRTLTYRVAYLLENGVPPDAILLLTFTNKAAREMLERVRNLLPDASHGIWSGTFHSIGNRILRRHAAEAGFEKGFSILDREDQESLLNSVIAEEKIDPKAMEFPKGSVLADILSFATNTGRPLAEVLSEKYDYFSLHLERIAHVQKRYEAKKRAANAVDFDDLLLLPLKLLRERAEIAQFYQKQFQYVLVDEYQDTNKIQADFIDVLSARYRNVMAVGDDAQSIYSWRGANFKNILDFPKRYPNTTIYKIETNYRSAPEILSVANAVIAGNAEQFAKTLRPSRAAASVRPGVIPLPDSNTQAQFVAQRIEELSEEGVPLNEIAVLYRAHYHSMELQMELTRRGVPFAITSGLRFFDQAHVKDVSAFLKLAVNRRDEVAFKRIARLLPGIGARSAEQLWRGFSAKAANGEVGELAISELAVSGNADDGAVKENAFSFADALLHLKTPTKARKGWEQLVYTLDEIAPGGSPLAPAKMIESVLEAIYEDYAKSEFANYEARREDLHTLANFARQFESAAEFLDQLALLGGLETEDALAAGEEAERVTLSSVHQAKGLEWRVVFVIWLTEGMFPSGRSLENEEAIEEERRLFYVAVTRSRDALYLTWPAMRMNANYGEMFQRGSRFLSEIPTELLEEWNIHGG